ncbi:MAG: hypothetical protein FWC00_05100 [Firmicutes bacterium]|nr:hypothetical protein [Bacillota bacterium]
MNTFLSQLPEPTKSSVMSAIKKDRPREILRVAKWWLMVALIPISLVIALVFLPHSALEAGTPVTFNDFIITTIFGAIFFLCILVIPFMIILPKRLLKRRAVARLDSVFANNPNIREANGFIIERETMLTFQSSSGSTSAGGLRTISTGQPLANIHAQGELFMYKVYIEGSDRLLRYFVWNDKYSVGDKIRGRFDPNKLKYVKVLHQSSSGSYSTTLSSKRLEF